MAQLDEASDKGGLATHKNFCPHVATAINIPQDLQVISSNSPVTCSMDGCDKGECWLCLKCHQILCGRYGNQHMVAHYVSSDRTHCMAMGINDLSFWCYDCSDYINHLSVQKIWQFYSIAHMARFNAPIPEGLYKKCTFRKPAQKTTFTMAAIDEKKENDIECDDEKKIDESECKCKSKSKTPCADLNLNNASTNIIDDLLVIFNSEMQIGYKKTALFYHKDCLLHTPGGGGMHVERPERCSTSYRMLNEYGLLKDLIEIEVREATKKELMATHAKKHVEIVFNNDGKQGWFDSDTFYNEYSTRAAKLAAGATIDLMRGMLQNKYHNGFALVRPPGHHCEHNKAMGFCLFNNAVIASNCVLNEKLCDKVLIVDWDVHHGNGTQNMFYDNENVLYFSVHRHDNGFFYPGTGKMKEHGNGYNINVPLNVSTDQGHGNKEYLLIWRDILLPICREFKPDIVLVSAGFDACIGDPLGGQRITPPCYGLMTRLLLNECDKVGIVLEGGYNLDTMPRAICCCNYALLKGAKQQQDNFDVDEFYDEFKQNITDGGSECEYEAFNKWLDDYGDELVDIDYNAYFKKRNKRRTGTSNFENEDFSNYGSCKKTVKGVLEQQQKYWKCVADILKKYSK